MKTRMLFVDDDESIRITLPLILTHEGFEVLVAGSVREALELIYREKFDILLSDLNIGSPGDGFTLVSAMRRVQPEAATMIITGYPDFESALEAIRQQVDGYVTKPADIPNLISEIKQKLNAPRQSRRVESRPVHDVLRSSIDAVLRLWLDEIKSNKELSSIELSDEDRIDFLPRILDLLADYLELGEVPPGLFPAGATHGELRARQGYTIPMMLAEGRILNTTLTNVLHEHLLIIDLSTMIGDILKIGEILSCLLEESIRAFQRAQSAPRVA